MPYTFPSCGFVYYLINAVLLLAGMVIFIIAAKKYQYQDKIDYNEHHHNAKRSQTIDVLKPDDLADNDNNYSLGDC